MNAARWRALSSHLDLALDLPRADRDGWVAALEPQEPTLSRELRALLAEHEAISDDAFLQESVSSRPDVSSAGRRIGAYTLVSPIGHGGMGTVWLATRSDGRFDGTCRDQAAESRIARPHGRIAVRARGPDPGATPPPEHRPSARRRRGGDGPALPRAGARGRRAHRRVLRPARARRPRAGAPLRGRARRRRARARQPDRPPRPQAVQRAGDRRWAGQAARLRHRQAARRRRPAWRARRCRAGPPSRRRTPHPSS